MNDFKVILPLVKWKKSILHKVCVWTGIVLLIASFVQFSGVSPEVSVILLFVGGVLLNIDYVIKDYDIAGDISLLPDNIAVRENGLVKTFLIGDMEQLEVFLWGVKGEFYRGRAIATKSGADNVIKVKHNGVVEEFQFLLEQNKVEQLSRLLYSWRKNGVAFRLHNQTRGNFEPGGR